MKNKTLLFILCCTALLYTSKIQAQLSPYVDDKLLHFGFSLSVDILSYNIEAVEGTPYQPRALALGPGFTVGFITDLRLCNNLNLRFTPALGFGERTITYANTDQPKQSILTIPISIPLYLKWSAARESIFRPYVIAGGGIQIECFRDKEKVILHEPFDAFVAGGFGCDFYFKWFKFCPEIKYHIGFLDAHVPTSRTEEEGWGIGTDKYIYTDAIQRMIHQKISITFNFE
jgi:hypothetical protein